MDARRSETLGSFAWDEAGLEDVRPGDVPPSKRLVVVLVGSLDRRVTVPLEQACRMTALERRALHVAVDENQLRAVQRGWAEQAGALPLFTIEDEGGVAQSVASVIEIELDAFDEVVVLVGRLHKRRLLHRLLHDRTADDIERALVGMPRVTTAITTVATT